MVQMNLSTKQKQRHRCRKQSYGYQGENREINWETGADIHQVLHTKQITRIYGIAWETLFSTL